VIYNLGNVVVKPGKLAEFLEIQKNELVPVFPGAGLRLSFSFHSYTGNMNEIYQMFEYKDLADMQKVRAALNQNKDYQKVSAKMSALIMSWNTTILEPNPWSPMK
jgi:hypothetical protein